MAFWFLLIFTVVIAAGLLLAYGRLSASEKRRRPLARNVKPEAPGSHDRLVSHWEAPGSRREQHT